MDHAFLEEQAKRCLDLANVTDPSTRRRLLDLATRYEQVLGRQAGITRRTKLPSCCRTSFPKHSQTVSRIFEADVFALGFSDMKATGQNNKYASTRIT
jgi:hypothetical protein